MASELAQFLHKSPPGVSLEETGSTSSDAAVTMTPIPDNKIKVAPCTPPPLDTRRQSSRHRKLPSDGCVVLGARRRGRKPYFTRYRIDHGRQRENLCRETMIEECVPCCASEEEDEEEEEEEGEEEKHRDEKEDKKMKNKVRRERKLKACCTVAIQVISSEVLLLTLHISAVIFGVAKEALDMRDYAEDLHLVHSLLETVAAVMVIALRIVAIWRRFSDLGRSAYALEHISEGAGRSGAPRGRALRRWVRIITALGILLILLAVACFAMFFYLLHLGWTILSNNFCIIVFSVAANLLLTRVNSAIYRVTEDQHKAVLYEAMTLLEGVPQAVSTDKDQLQPYMDRIQDFLGAARNTDLLKRPEHIVLEQEEEDVVNRNLDLITTLEMQSIV